MNRPGTIAWLARHELRLSLRDASSMLRGGRKARFSVVLSLLVLTALLHFVAWTTVGQYGGAAAEPDARSLVVVTAAIVFSACLLLSQAIESITRVLYGRGDLDLILSSPISPRLVLAVRVAIIGIGVSAMTLLLAGPFANVLILTGGARWLGVYPTVLSVAFTMTALGLLVTLALVRIAGPARTRLAAQIVAAIIGSAFAIGLQIAAILQYGEMSRFAVVASDAALTLAPGPESPLWLPARAVMGDPVAAVLALLGGAACLGLVLLAGSGSLARAAYATAGAVVPTARSRPPAAISIASPDGALRWKEWRLLARDPWLVSQTLMQVLYLLPPAVMLWQVSGEGAAKLVVLVPILVMTAGQLAGSLAWLAISGEDAPDLIASAPIRAGSVVRAKLISVLAILAAIVLPFGLMLAAFSAWLGLVMVAGALVAGTSAFSIQFWFRHQGRRSQFRRRQTASRIATFAEAFSSILWAATAALAAAATPLAAAAGAAALLCLGAARLLSPKRIA